MFRLQVRLRTAGNSFTAHSSEKYFRFGLRARRYVPAGAHGRAT